MIVNARVSVIVPVLNGARWLREALESVIDQTMDDFEVIVVDDGSDDGSPDIARSMGGLDESRIRVLEFDHGGLATARNRGMERARGHYFAFLDSDDAWLPHHLETAMAAFEHDPDLGLVHANIQRVDENGAAIEVPRRHWDTEEDAFEVIALRHEHVSCPTVVVAREAIDAVGGFDERFNGLGCEDRDLWLRISERFRVRYIDQVTARYRMHASSMSVNRERMDRARRLLIAKLGDSRRGRALVGAMEAMLESDLGLEFLKRGQMAAALRQQVIALRLDPGARVVWKRLLRVAAEGFRPRRFLPRKADTLGGVE